MRQQEEQKQPSSIKACTIRRQIQYCIGKRCLLGLVLLVLPLTTTEALVTAAAPYPNIQSAAAAFRRKLRADSSMQLSSTVAHQHETTSKLKSSSAGSCGKSTNNDSDRVSSLQQQQQIQSSSSRSLSSLGTWFTSSSSPSPSSSSPSSRNSSSQKDKKHSTSTSNSISNKNNNKFSDYQRRKNDWAQKYCSVDSLRLTFGSNQNKLWGDLDAPTARRLYKTLLPKALLDLYKLGVEPQDLAPLAYRARVAAKLYARERCRVPARYLAHWYDGFRQWRNYGSFDTTGMTYQQVWNKYASVIVNECAGQEGLSDHDVTAMICCKILEKSCTTNEMVDRLVMSQKNRDKADQADLQHFTDTLERDVRLLLKVEQEQQRASSQQHKQLDGKRYKMLRRLVKLKQQVRQAPNVRRKPNNHDDKTKDWE
jgi:hypothetical protein